MTGCATDVVLQQRKDRHCSEEVPAGWGKFSFWCGKTTSTRLVVVDHQNKGLQLLIMLIIIGIIAWIFAALIRLWTSYNHCKAAVAVVWALPCRWIYDHSGVFANDHEKNYATYLHRKMCSQALLALVIGIRLILVGAHAKANGNCIRIANGIITSHIGKYTTSST